MNKDDVKFKIINSEPDIWGIVGPNYSGKSYLLNHLFTEIGNNALLIDENGVARSINIKNKVKISGDLYVYEDALSRGRSRVENESYQITVKSKNIIDQVNQTINSIGRDKSSMGVRKIINILDALLQHNLNNLKYILIDEPENFLDDLNFKNISNIFKILKDNSLKVIFVTHNPRFLELMKIKTDNLFILTHMHSDIINIHENSVMKLFNETNLAISTDQSVCFTNAPKFDRLKFLMPPKMLSIYLRQFLSSTEYYQSIFYNKVVIVEGKSEKVVIQKNDSLPILMNNFVYSYGKLFIPFLVKFYQTIGKSIIVLMDNDQSKIFYKKLGDYIIQNILLKNDRYHIFDDDLETFLNLGNDVISDLVSDYGESISPDDLKNQGYFKPFFCEHAINLNSQLNEKVTKLIETLNEK